jgi:hypothetical protein
MSVASPCRRLERAPQYRRRSATVNGSASTGAAGADVEFEEMDPDGFDTLVFPDLTFRVPKGPGRPSRRAAPADEPRIAGDHDAEAGYAAVARGEFPTDPWTYARSPR